MKKTLLIFFTVGALLFCACGKGNNGESGTEGGNTDMLPQLGGEITSKADGNGKLPHYTAVSEKDAKAAMEAVCDGFDSDSTETIKEGLKLRSLSFGESNVYILTAELDKFSIKTSTPYGLAPDGTLQSLLGQKQLAEKNGIKAVAAIATNEVNKATNIPKGMLITGGKLLYTAKGNDGSVFFGLYEDGTPFACTYSEYTEIYRNNVSEMVSAAHIIALNGKAVSVAGSIHTEKTTRTGGGFYADGSKLCIVYGENIDTDQLSKLLIGSGCSVGVSFDSGSELGLLCENNMYGTNIAVGPALLITEK